MKAAEQRCAYGELQPVNTDGVALVFDIATKDKRDLLSQSGG